MEMQEENGIIKTTWNKTYSANVVYITNHRYKKYCNVYIKAATDISGNCIACK